MGPCLTACIVTSTRCWKSTYNEQADLAEIAAKVTEVLADLILMAPPAEELMLMADVVANLGGMVREKSQDTEPTNSLAQNKVAQRPTRRHLDARIIGSGAPGWPARLEFPITLRSPQRVRVWVAR
jgi:hypothetical protein